MNKAASVGRLFHFMASVQCRLLAASSTGRRNTCVKSLCWGFTFRTLL
jgi:hypothetical protein